MTREPRNGDATRASSESSPANPQHQEESVDPGANSNLEDEIWVIPAWRRALSQLGSYYNTNLLFVRILALLAIVFVSSLVVFKMREGTNRPVKRSDVPDRFGKHIWGQKSRKTPPRRPFKLTKKKSAKVATKESPARRIERRIQRRGLLTTLKSDERGSLGSFGSGEGGGGLSNAMGSSGGNIIQPQGLRGRGSGWGGVARRRVYGRAGPRVKRRRKISVFIPEIQRRRYKSGKNKIQKKAGSQVWQRTRTNTVLSKVSVGGKKYLVLKKLRVTVHVDGLRARTVLDHIYYNPYKRTLQGTFKYTLPPEASVSYYAMFVGQQRRRPRFFASNRLTPKMLAQTLPQKLAPQISRRDWGTLREARLVPAEKGRKVYEDITRVRIDPALLEQDAPNTFKGRVFPIPSKGYNRVILAYEHTLPQLQSSQVYRLSFPNDVADSIDFTLHYNSKNQKLQRSNLRKLRCKTNPQMAMHRCMWEKNKPDRDAVFYFQPKNPKLSWVTGTDPTSNQSYLFARMKAPNWKSTATYSAQHGLFAVDTSLSANPDLFAVHIKLLMKILKNNQGTLKYFNVMFFDISQRWYSQKKWLQNTEKERRRLRRTLRRIILEGATYGADAVRGLASPPQARDAKNVDIFMLSDGQWNWNQSSVEAAMAQFDRKSPWSQTRWFAYRTGLGNENINGLVRLTSQRGAVFTCLGRGELNRCVTAHTQPSMVLKNVTIEGVKASEILSTGQQTHIYPGAWVGVTSKFAKAGNAKVTFSGSYMGKSQSFTYTFAVNGEGDLAPRAWAEQAIQKLNALNDSRYNKLIVAYAQHFRIPNQHCSYLVLETDKEYKTYGLEQEKRAHKVRDVVQILRKNKLKKQPNLSPKQQWTQLLRKLLKKSKKAHTSSGRHILRLLRGLPESAYPQPTTLVASRLWMKRTVPWVYRKKRKKHNDYRAYSREAKRRLKFDAAGAVRCITSIVEVNQGRPESLRLVGYYLLSWKQASLATDVFLKVLRRRSFEPHSYRDLARSLTQQKHFALASVLYELILQKKWDARFGRIHTLVQEEYAQLINNIRQTKVATSIRRPILQRKALLGLKLRPSKLRVTVSWNTDNTDIDLWVYEPGGGACSYKRMQTRNGGNLLEDVRQGYGPERYENQGGESGTYKLQLHYFGNNSNTLGNETHVNVQIVLNEGSPSRKVIEKSLVLRRAGGRINIARLKL